MARGFQLICQVAGLKVWWNHVQDSCNHTQYHRQGNNFHSCNDGSCNHKSDHGHCHSSSRRNDKHFNSGIKHRGLGLRMPWVFVLKDLWDLRLKFKDATFSPHHFVLCYDRMARFPPRLGTNNLYHGSRGLRAFGAECSDSRVECRYWRPTMKGVPSSFGVHAKNPRVFSRPNSMVLDHSWDGFPC